MDMYIKSILLAKAISITISWAAISFFTIRYFVLRHMKLKELFGSNVPVRMIPPFFILDKATIPNSSDGQRFREHCEKNEKQLRLIIFFCFVGMLIGIFLPVDQSALR